MRNARTNALCAVCGSWWRDGPDTYLWLETGALPYFDTKQPVGPVVKVAALTYDGARSILGMVADLGGMFLPKAPLTQREQGYEGPSHCWREECAEASGRKRLLRFEDFYLGCVRCRYYVCACGYCLCDLPEDRWNYLCQPFPKAGSGSGFNPEERSALLHIARYLTMEVAKAFPDKPLIAGREPYGHYAFPIWPDADPWAQVED